LEGIIAALRALQQEDVKSLLEIYKILTGNTYVDLTTESSIMWYMDDPEKLADVIIFNLKPIEVWDMEHLRNLNKTLLQFIQSA